MNTARFTRTLQRTIVTWLDVGSPLAAAALLLLLHRYRLPTNLALSSDDGRAYICTKALEQCQEGVRVKR